jgi:cytochrome c2
MIYFNNDVDLKFMVQKKDHGDMFSTNQVEGRKLSQLIVTCFLVIIIPFISISFSASSLFGEEDDHTLPGNPLEGRKIFVGKGCVSCHSIWGAGGKMGPDLGRVGKELSFLQFAGLLWSHSPKMVEVMEEQGISRPTLTPEEMAHLVSYLYFINYFDDPGDFLTGERLFKEKQCVRCHSVGGKGGEVGPNLDRYAVMISPIFITQAMWNHGIQMAQKMAEMKIPRPKFEGNEIAHILAYIRGAAIGEWGERQYMLPGNPKDGKRTFQEKGCIRCHSIRGEGATVGPDLGKREFQSSVTETAGRMWNHGPKMWSKMKIFGISPPILTGEEMANLIAYLYFINYFDESGDIVKGEIVFHKKGCASCHSFRGEGAKIGPDLSLSEAVLSPIHMSSAMWNHASTMEEIVEERGLPWPRFEGTEMRDLAEYIHSQRVP